LARVVTRVNLVRLNSTNPAGRKKDGGTAGKLVVDCSGSCFRGHQISALRFPCRVSGGRSCNRTVTTAQSTQLNYIARLEQGLRLYCHLAINWYPNFGVARFGIRDHRGLKMGSRRSVFCGDREVRTAGGVLSGF
jgi:hypothetical protein